MHKPFCDFGGNPKTCLGRLLSLSKGSNGKLNKKLISEAFYLAMEAHKGQFRKSKEPYFSHPLESAAILANLGLSSEVIAAALLHDVLEDTKVKGSEIKKRFGKEVFTLVEGVTKLDLLSSEVRSHNSKGHIYSLLFATTRDPRVILIKLSDKLHNLRTLHHLPARDRRRIATEALTVYVPIAHKIGLEELAVEFEDLAFENARPETFRRMENRLKPMRKSKRKEISLMVKVLRRKLKGVRFDTKQRSAYSIYTKMQNTKKILDQLNDCVILTIIAGSEPECYSALGVVHSVFPPLPNKVKDFIAAPKPSLYRVLQTTVFGPEGQPVKVRIMTQEMDEVNRLGVIAYRKLYGKRLSKEMGESLSNLGFLLQEDAEDDFMHALKADFLTRPIYVFNDEGKLVELSKKSTVLDFAFVTEKNWALHLRKAKVNGKKVSFGKRLEYGQVVELFFSKEPQVKRDWLLYANSFLARDGIRKALKLKRAKVK